MERIIEVDLVNKDDFYDKYNKKNISKDLINYLVDCVYYFDKDDTIKVVIANNSKEDIIFLIKEGLNREYDKSISLNFRNDFVQLWYLIIGVLILFLSTLIKGTIFKEIVLIGGWVFIWAMIESEIFTDINSRRKRRIIKRLLNSEFEVIKK